MYQQQYHHHCSEPFQLLAEEPDQLVMTDFKKWRSRDFPKSTATYTAPIAGKTTNTTNITSTTSNITAPVTQMKLEKDAYLSRRRGKQDPTLYPILENDQGYTDWIIKTRCQLTSDECERIIDHFFLDNQVHVGADSALFETQKKHIAIVLERVLQTNEGYRLTRKHPKDP